MSESIAQSLCDILGARAASLLVNSIPDLELLQLQLFYIHHRSKQLGHKSMAFAENQIRKIFDDFEDAIHDYVSRSAHNPLMELVAKTTLKQKIKALTVRSRWTLNSLEVCKHDVIDEQLKDLSVSRVGDLQNSREACVTKNDVIDEQLKDLFIGRVEDLEKLESALVGNMDCSTVCILGVAGIGKTTLAKKLFHQLDYHFERFAWLNVPRKRYDKERLLKDLLLQLDTETRYISDIPGDKVVRELYKLQTECQCLIVLDGVWCVNNWFSLVDAFPSKKDGSISKVLITTPAQGVGEMVAEKSGVVHALKAFSEDESWTLITKKVGRHGIDICASKELLIRKLARKCNHIPLAINLLAGHLARNHDWRALCQNWEVEREKDVMQHMLAQIFRDLPANLKHCLFYMAAFFENLEIDTTMLYTLWIAEGLVQSKYGEPRKTLIQIADRYLQDLESRGLVQVVKEDYLRSRKCRSCRLNSVIRDISILTAKEENYLMVIGNKGSTTTSYDHSSSSKVPKVAAHLNTIHIWCCIWSEQKRTENIHSVLLLGASTMLNPYNNSFNEETLHMLMGNVLKVLHLDDLNFGAGIDPRQIEKFVLLRYLSFRSCYLTELPLAISKLSNLQTLDLRVRDFCVVTIHNVLRKLRRMKHLYLPQLFRLHNNEKLRLDTLTELETLENFDSKLCFARDLIQLINLRFLTASIFDNVKDLQATVKSSKYLCEASLRIKHFKCFPQSEIEKLFQCNGLNSLYLGGHLGRLPSISCSSLTVMVFNGSKFDDDPMPVLGRLLPNLRVLALDNYAFMGEELFSSEGFGELRYLRFSTLPKLKSFIIGPLTMGNLYCLTILGCKNISIHPYRLKQYHRKLKLINLKTTIQAFEELQALQDGTQFEELSKYSMY